MTISEILSSVNIVITVLLGVAIVILTYNLNKRLKAYEIWVEEVHELNTKMHDRLVDVEDSIKADKRPPDELRKRLLYNASRLYKYDETIIDDVGCLINNWTEMFAHLEKGSISSDELSESKISIYSLVKTIKSKVDKVQQKLN